MRITDISARGLLSFEDFALDLDSRITVVVGPNGSGKSNLGRVVELVRRAIESADRSSTQLEQTLAMFYAGRREFLPPHGIEVRVGFELTDEFERQLLVAFVQAAAAAALVGNTLGADTEAIETWVERQITVRRLTPLFRGALVVAHNGTSDAHWQVGVDFQIAGRGRKRRSYRWMLRGNFADAILAVDNLPLSNLYGEQLADRLRGRPQAQGRPTAPSGVFALSRLLPRDRRTVFCSLDLGRNPPLRACRHFARMIGVDPLGGADPIHHYGFARVMATVLQRGLVQTSDSRLLPPAISEWTSVLRPRAEGEGNLPEMLLLLKNAPANERPLYEAVRRRFWELSRGRQIEVVATPVSPSGSTSTEADKPVTVEVMPHLLVSADTVNVEERGPIAQVPIEFAGAGAWEALVLASVLGAQATSTVVLDEPAVALHPTLQRQVKSHLLASAAQFIVITHSPYILPLESDQTDVQVVRFELDERLATRAWRVDPSLLAKVSKKLVAKGNEGLPFAWKVVLCEGESDVDAVHALARRIQLDLNLLNIAVVDCGSRDNLPDYVALSDALGIPFLALMDGDALKASANVAVNRKVKAVREAVQRSQRGCLVEFPENIETTLLVNKQRPSLIPKALEKINLDTCPIEVADLVTRLRELV
jgi:hypothetical protein